MHHDAREYHCLDRPIESESGAAEVNAAVTVVSLEIRVASAGVSLGLRAADAGHSATAVLHWFPGFFIGCTRPLSSSGGCQTSCARK